MSAFAAMADPIELPISLPPHWRTERDSVGNVLLEACDCNGGRLGWVTVDERGRCFALGMCRPTGRASLSEYAGHGWRAQLYTRAVQALQVATGPVLAC